MRGVGEDPKAAIAPVTAAGQSLVHRLRRMERPTGCSGLTIPWRKAAPRSHSPIRHRLADPYNLSVVEILAAPPSGTRQRRRPCYGRLWWRRVRNTGANSTSEGSVTMYNPATGATGEVCSPGGLASLSGAGFTSQNAQSAASLPLADKSGWRSSKSQRRTGRVVVCVAYEGELSSARNWRPVRRSM